MLFIKNILKKKNFNGYVISFIAIIFSLILFFNLYIKNQNDYLNILNKEIYRTIELENNVNITSQDYIESITVSDMTTVIVKDYQYVTVFINSLPPSTNFNTYSPPEENSILFNSIKIVIMVLIIFFIIIAIIYIYQFIVDDLKVINILYIIGYSKKTIIFKYTLSFIIIYTIVYIVSLLLELLINLVFIKYINFKLYFFFTSMIYLLFLFIIIITILFSFINLKVKK